MNFITFRVPLLMVWLGLGALVVLILRENADNVGVGIVLFLSCGAAMFLVGALISSIYEHIFQSSLRDEQRLSHEYAILKKLYKDTLFKMQE